MTLILNKIKKLLRFSIMKRFATAFVVVILIFAPVGSYGQDARKVIRLTLDEAVSLARENSPSALSAKHSFRASYWSWRSYKGDQLPSLSLSSGPTLNRNIRPILQPDGSEVFKKQDKMSTDVALWVTQNVPFTGGDIYMKTQLSRLDMFSSNSVDWQTTPLVVGYRQNLFGYNDLKWQKRLEPLRYEKAKKEYIQNLEDISQDAVGYFYALAAAQTDYQVANENYDNAENNFRFGEGRYNVGTITEDEMMQLEIALLTQQTNVIKYRMDMEDWMRSLRNFLGITDDSDIVLTLNDEVPFYRVDEEATYEMALENNAKVIGFKVDDLQAQSDVARAKSEKGFQADMSLEFGLNQTSRTFSNAYKKPSQSQFAKVTLSVPILDWGKGKGRVKMAESRRDQALVKLEQDKIDFRLNITKAVRQFNMQYDQIIISRKRLEVSKRRHDVAQKQYQLGKIGMTDLNNAIADKDNAEASHISSLNTFWELHYAIRQITGYDFENNQPLTANFDQIIK